MLNRKITRKTFLKQGDLIFLPIEIDGIVYWVIDEYIKNVRPNYGRYHIEENSLINIFPTYLTDLNECRLIVAQSQPNLEGIPLISLNLYIEKLAKEYTGDEMSREDKKLFDILCSFGKKILGEHPYTLKDIEKAIMKGRLSFLKDIDIIEQVNSIHMINVDEQFNILSYV
jgi:hypothetical protein